MNGAGASVQFEGAPNALGVARWTKDGQPIFHASFGNLVTILEKDPRLSGRFRVNDFAGTEEWSPPDGPDLVPIAHTLHDWNGPHMWEEMSDHAAQAIAVFIEYVYDIRVEWRKVSEAVSYVANKTHTHPVREYLGRVAWDGVDRLSTWLVDYCGAQDTALFQAIGRAWMISAVARVMAPGCKSDHVLLFHGKQGRGKSSLLGVLGGDWYSDQAINVQDKQAGLALRGVWLHEFAELDALSRSEVTATKAFLTQRTDRFRPPYGKHYVVAPRQTAFSGSTNEETFLSDVTGNRRFWVVRCQAIDIEGVRSARDQLWAQAAAACKAGEPHWLDAPTADQHAADVEQYVHEDPWDSAIRSWCAGKGSVVVADIYSGCLKKELGDVTRIDQLRVSGALRRLGWERKRARWEGVATWVWVK